jgi:translation elongation factor EF-1alpha
MSKLIFPYWQLEFHIHHAKEPARVSKILSVLDPKTGKVTKKSPRCLTSKQSAVIEVNNIAKLGYFNREYTNIVSPTMQLTQLE